MTTHQKSGDVEYNLYEKAVDDLMDCTRTRKAQAEKLKTLQEAIREINERPTTQGITDAEINRLRSRDVSFDKAERRYAAKLERCKEYEESLDGEVQELTEERDRQREENERLEKKLVRLKKQLKEKRNRSLTRPTSLSSRTAKNIGNARTSKRARR